MATRIKTRRICPEGHTFYKSTDCPSCPVCEKKRFSDQPEHFLSILSAPARRGLDNLGIDSLEKLSVLTQGELLSIHGVGPVSLPKINQALSAAKLKLREIPAK